MVLSGIFVGMSTTSAALPSPSDLKKLNFWRRSTFFVMLFGYVGYYICRKNISAAFPLMSLEFGYSNEQLGLIAFASELAYAAGKFINGPLGDRIGGRKIFLIGMAGAIIFNFVFAAGSTITYFVVAWCACRYFLSMGWGGLAKVIGNWYEPERNGTVMGFISLNFQFGGVVASLLAGLIVSMGGSWRDVFIYPALLLILIFIWSYFASKDSPQDVVPGTSFGTSTAGRKSVLAASSEGSLQEKSSFISNISALMKLPLYRQLLVYSFLTTFLRSVFFFWTPKILVDIGLGTSNAIFKSALFPLLGCVGTIFLGWYTDKHAKHGNRARMMWIMLSGLVVCLFLIAMFAGGGAIGGDGAISSWAQSWIVILLGMSGFFLLGPYSMSSGCLTLDIAGADAAGSCTGVIDGLGYIGGALAVWLAGRFSDQMGWSQVFFALGVMAVFAMLSAMKMSRGFVNAHKNAQI